MCWAGGDRLSKQEKKSRTSLFTCGLRAGRVDLTAVIAGDLPCEPSGAFPDSLPVATCRSLINTSIASSSTRPKASPYPLLIFAKTATDSALRFSSLVFRCYFCSPDCPQLFTCSPSPTNRVEKRIKKISRCLHLLAFWKLFFFFFVS